VFTIRLEFRPSIALFTGFTSVTYQAFGVSRLMMHRPSTCIIKVSMTHMQRAKESKFIRILDRKHTSSTYMYNGHKANEGLFEEKMHTNISLFSGLLRLLFVIIAARASIVTLFFTSAEPYDIASECKRVIIC
jgi:hypothetical protein